MEGSESGALVPSDTIMEVETWVKLSNVPAKFLTAEAISFIVSSFGSPVASDVDTYEKVENHKRPPKLRRKLHSRKTFVTILVRVSVTKPLPSRVAVGCTKGREYTIWLDFDPTPKVCLLCLGAGHFDFECCGTKAASVEVTEDDVVAVENFVGGDLQLDACFDSMNDEVDGEQGSVTTDGAESYEDPSVIVDVDLPTATCGIGDALGGELEAAPTIFDGFSEQSLVERTSAVLEEQPLLPAADGNGGLVISDGFVCFEDPPVVEAVLEVSPLSLPPASCVFGAAIAGELEAVQAFSDSVDDEPLVGKEIAADPLATAGESSAADPQKLAAVAISDGFDEEPTVVRMVTGSCPVDELMVGFNVLFPFEPGPVFLLQFIMDKVLNDYLIAAGNLFGLLFCSLKHSSFELSSFEDFYVVKSSRQHHKWREKTVEQRFLEGDSGSGEGFLGVDMQDADCIGDIFAFIDGVQGAVIIDRAVWYDNPTVVEAALVEDLHNIEQVFFVVKSSNKHHKWREKSDVQGLVCCSNVLGLSEFDEHSSVEIKETSAVLPFSDFGAANFGTSPAAFLQGRADSCFDQDIFEEWEELQSLGRFMAATNSTHDQLIFKIQHKWREKSMDWSADRIWVLLMY